MSLPKDYVEKWNTAAKGSAFLGHSIEGLTKEELVAVATHGWTELNKATEALGRESMGRMQDAIDRERRPRNTVNSV